MLQSTQPSFAMCSSIFCAGYEGVLGKIHTKIHTGSFVFRIAGKKGKDALVFLFGMCIPDMSNLVQVVPGQAGAEVSKLKRFIAYRAEQRLCL